VPEEPILGKPPMVHEDSWQEFREAGLLWWVNRSLHLFGWALAVEQDQNGRLVNAYPVRCKFRGFGEDSETRGFRRLTQYLVSHTSDLLEGIDVDNHPEGAQGAGDASNEGKEGKEHRVDRTV